MASQSAKAKPWQIKPQNYIFEKPAFCPIKLRKSDNYQPCADHIAVLEKALQTAKAQNKLLIVKFGANWCPWCRKLHKVIPSKQVLGFKGDGFDYEGRFMLVEMAVSTLKRGQGEVKIPSGTLVSDILLKKLSLSKAKLKGIPYLMILDPNKEGAGIFRRSKYLEKRLFGLIYHYKGVSYEPFYIRLLLKKTWRQFRP